MLTNPIHPRLGATRQPDGTVEWSVWAPRAPIVELVLDDRADGHVHQMQRVDEYHTLRLPNVPEGQRYSYRLNGIRYPDPASRCQPDGVFGDSAVFTVEDFQWNDADWSGVPRENLVIYELHVGTFTPQGTFHSVIPRLTELRDLGVTAIEIMPISQFPGMRNWGYDGVFPFAAQNSYGGPCGLQKLVNAAHRLGIAVLLDVVYNHFGPEGNVLHHFGPYFTSAYRTPWGDALNFDGPFSDAVRHYVLENVAMWIQDFHLDGLRLDAVHAIYDMGARHLLAEIQRTAQKIAAEQSRVVHVIAESDQNNPRLIDSEESHGFGLSAVWADEFHHSLRALIAKDQQGYFEDFGKPEDLAMAFQHVFVHDGRYSRHRKRRHGAPVEDRDRTQFVVCIHNHDQIGNRAFGDRSPSYLSEAAQRLSGGLLMLSPCIPMLFMGEEYAEMHPFPFFCSFQDPQLVEAVRKGRRKEFADLGFEWADGIPDPQAEETFRSAVLAWTWPKGSFSAQLRSLYRDLIAARRQWAPLRERQGTTAEVIRPDGDTPLLIVRRGSQNKLTAVANLTSKECCLPQSRTCDPVILSTEDFRYGGAREGCEAVERILPHELLIFSKETWRP